MAEQDESLSQEQIGDLIRRLLGPPEEWDDDAAEFVLDVYGIDPERAGSYVQDLILREIDSRRKRGDAIPPALLRMLSSLTDEAKDEVEAAKVERYLRQQLKPAVGQPESEDMRMLRAARRSPGKLSKDDERILKDLEEELARDVDGKEQS